MPPEDDLTGISEDKLYAAMSYLFFLVVVPLISEKYKNDPFVKFHARQGLVTAIILVLSLILAAWVSSIGSTLFLIVVILDIIGLVMALQGKYWRIPGISQIADKFSL